MSCESHNSFVLNAAQCRGFEGLGPLRKCKGTDAFSDLLIVGCQVILTKELDGLRLQLPTGTRNFYVDGHVPQPH